MRSAAPPELDPYDPTKPEYIRPATAKEIVEESAKQRRQQIDRLELALSNNEGHRSTKPRILLRYRQYLRELQPGRRAQPGVLREARDVPMPGKEGKAEGGPPTHSSPADIYIPPALLTSACLAQSPGAAIDGMKPVPEHPPPSPAKVPRPQPRTSSAPALPFVADDGVLGERDGVRHCSSASFVPSS